MQISGTTVSPSAGSIDGKTTDSDRKAASKAAADVSAQPKAQQDKVTISDAARKAQLQDQKNAQTPAAANKAAAGQKATADQDDNTADTTTETKGFVYGALGLERPEEEAANVPPDGYTAGRWLAAALTVGALVSILV